MEKGQTTKLWAKVKRIRGSKSTATDSLNNETDDVRIANVFSCKYYIT